MSLSKSKCLYSNNCLQFLKCAVPFVFDLFKPVINSCTNFGFCLFHFSAFAPVLNNHQSQTNFENNTQWYR